MLILRIQHSHSDRTTLFRRLRRLERRPRIRKRVEHAPKRLSPHCQQPQSDIKIARTQMSTLSSIVVPVLTSNSSGALYVIVLCSAAKSWWANACDLFSILIRALRVLPKSIKMGVTPSSAIMTFLGARRGYLYIRGWDATYPGLRSLCAYGT